MHADSLFFSIFSENLKKKRYRENAKLKRAKFNAKQVPKATIKLARWKVLMWGQPKVDVWSDELYWVHRRSGAVRWTKPTTQEYVPANFVMPAQYRYVTEICICTRSIYESASAG